MSELRVALLVISAGFLAGLSWWEWRRPRQAHAGDGARRAPREAELPPAAPARSATESTLVLPEIRAHEPLGRHELPVVELPPSPPAHVATPAPIEPDAVVDLGARNDPYADDEPDGDDDMERDEELDVEELDAVDELDPGSEQPPAAVAMTVPETTLREELPRLPTAPPPVVEWPPDAERRIVSLRLVATAPERFVGRSLRQALAAEGFVLGRFAIFHKPDEEQRAVLSAASLTRPGTFDADTMDSQHFGGLSLFAVLPGPRPPSQAFEELINTARNLNDRLQGALQDERGSPLTTARIALLRERVNSGASA